MIRNYKFTIVYDGGRYYGWQRLGNKDTIQGRIENVLSKMCDREVTINGAGRTDAGVHAKGMVANAVLECEMTPEEIKSYVNSYLPDDIAIKSVSVAAERFHARYNATGKSYTYTCYVGQIKPVFDRKYVTVLSKMPDVEAMKKAARYLIGEHDFFSFQGNSKMKKSTVRNIDNIDIVLKNDYLYFNYHGDGFLQNMVRILTGTLLEVGYGNMKPENMTDILEAKDRSKAGPKMPPEGLCLLKVDYD
ncbi:MAG: tRNA pseudouridine(38-40) synthase TruA [Lachnospiraceae bacterium]|nr:tRNA pseudouridine(38-40) synthase TruA [Lachnospiraceae bacterium]